MSGLGVQQFSAVILSLLAAAKDLQIMLLCTMIH